MNIENLNNSKPIDNKFIYIRISDGRNYIYDYRRILASNGFEFNKRSKGNSFYELKTTDDMASFWEKYAKRNKLRITVIPEEYARSTDYRETYFKSNRPAIEAKYRCAYCGKMMEYRNTTIDHIFPINKLSYDPAVRRRAARWGINGANEEKNLVPACRSCNCKKGTKMGFWIYRGFLGKSENLWKFRKTMRVAIICTILLTLLYLYAESKKPQTFAYNNEKYKIQNII